MAIILTFKIDATGVWRLVGGHGGSVLCFFGCLLFVDVRAEVVGFRVSPSAHKYNTYRANVSFVYSWFIVVLRYICDLMKKLCHNNFANGKYEMRM